MERLERWARERLELEEPLVMAGDYNVIPEPVDARFPENWVSDALFQPETRPAFRRLENIGFTEAVRATTDAGVYTFWDYQAGAWQKDNGIRIDHLLLSPEAANRLAGDLDRQACARLGETVRPCAGGGGVVAERPELRPSSGFTISTGLMPRRSSVRRRSLTSFSASCLSALAISAMWRASSPAALDVELAEHLDRLRA